MATITKMTTTRIGINPPFYAPCMSRTECTRSRPLEKNRNKKRRRPKDAAPRSSLFGELYIMLNLVLGLGYYCVYNSFRVRSIR